MLSSSVPTGRSGAPIGRKLARLRDIVTSDVRRQAYLATRAIRGLGDPRRACGCACRYSAAGGGRGRRRDGGEPYLSRALCRRVFAVELVGRARRRAGRCGVYSAAELLRGGSNRGCRANHRGCDQSDSPLYREPRAPPHPGGSRPAVLFTPGVYRGFDHEKLVNHLRVVRRAGGFPIHVVVGGIADGRGVPLADLMDSGSQSPPVFKVDAAAVSELISLSGTEARPKAIMHTEQTAGFSMKVAAEVLGITHDDVVWMPSPVGHSTGFNYGVRFASPRIASCPAHMGTLSWPCA